MHQNLPFLNLSNEGDDLILETYASNEHWNEVLKIKEGKKLCKYYSESFNNAEFNYHTMEKEILVVIRGIEKFLICLSPKPFLIQTDYKGILNFVKENLSNMQAQGRLLCWQLWLNYFSFSIEHIQGSKNSVADSLTRKLANCDHQSKTPAGNGENLKWNAITARTSFSF